MCFAENSLYEILKIDGVFLLVSVYFDLGFVFALCIADNSVVPFFDNVLCKIFSFYECNRTYCKSATLKSLGSVI